MASRIYLDRSRGVIVLHDDGTKRVIPAACDGTTDDTAAWQAALDAAAEEED